MVNFIPEKATVPTFNVPYFEDNPVAKIDGRATEKPVAKLQQEVCDQLAMLGATVQSFQLGVFPAPVKRYGYVIHFRLDGLPGRIDCAALPIRNETVVRKDRALAQALYLLRDWLKAEFNSAIYRPGSIPLVPYLLGGSGKTVTEELVERAALPEFNARYLPSGN